MGLAILRDLLDNTVKSPDDVADKLHAPCWSAARHQIAEAAQRPLHRLLDDHTSHFAEAVRTARTSLALSGLEKPHKITVITSTTPGEANPPYRSTSPRRWPRWKRCC